MTSADTNGEEFTRLFSGLERTSDPSADEPHGEPVGWRTVPWIERDGAANPDLWADCLAWLDLGDEMPADAPESDHQEPAPIVRELGPADPAAITDELGLGHVLTVREMLRVRRAFALRNHPDLFPPEQRELATQRMRIANILIDDALQQTSRGHR